MPSRNSRRLGRIHVHMLLSAYVCGPEPAPSTLRLSKPARHLRLREWPWEARRRRPRLELVRQLFHCRCRYPFSCDAHIDFRALRTENPGVRFIHSYPGLTATTTPLNCSRGLIGFLLNWIVTPIANRFFAISVAKAESRVLRNSNFLIYLFSDFSSESVSVFIKQ